MKSSRVIGIAGGSGSGKTTLALKILNHFGPSTVAYLQEDSYYKSLERLPRRLRREFNYDHPDAFETALIIDHILALLKGEPINQPVFDYITLSRKLETEPILPQPIILIEGILVLHDPQLRRLLDLKFFLDTDADIRFIRRLHRDMRERARSVESIIEQYITTVRPMHIQYVEPSKYYADMIIRDGEQEGEGSDLLTRDIVAMLDQAAQQP